MVTEWVGPGYHGDRINGWGQSIMVTEWVGPVYHGQNGWGQCIMVI